MTLLEEGTECAKTWRRWEHVVTFFWSYSRVTGMRLRWRARCAHLWIVESPGDSELSLSALWEEEISGGFSFQGLRLTSFYQTTVYLKAARSNYLNPQYLVQGLAWIQRTFRGISMSSPSWSSTWQLSEAHVQAVLCSSRMTWNGSTLGIT